MRSKLSFAGLATLFSVAALGACDAVTGLGDYSKCFENCGSAGGDAGPGADGGGGGGPDATPPAIIDKVDLLLVIDNSRGMLDKQQALAKQLPGVLVRLTGAGTGTPAKDVHIAVITSSLGSHGTSACAVEITNKHNDDHGWLVPRAGEKGSNGYTATATSGTPTAQTCPTVAAASAISWVAGASLATAQTAGTCAIDSVKEDGCGYEETWESMVHFLVDPAPYQTAAVKCTYGGSGDSCGANKIVVSGVDDTLLAQRASFLRPDSVLAVLVVSDENDMSLKPAGVNWLPWAVGKGQMQRGWADCAQVPDDFEPDGTAEASRLKSEFNCNSCFEASSDPNCAVKWPSTSLNADVDGRNLRGFQQVQRYGFNFLWGRQRYVDAFAKASVPGSDLIAAPNPVFAGGQRDLSMIVVGALVGVPSQLTPGPTLSAADWVKITGPFRQRDPHMIESIAPRAGVPRFAGNRAVDPINGGDRDVADGDDLQYACIAKRAMSGLKGFDCNTADDATKNPLCEADGTQSWMKAYPGLRHARIIQSLGDNGVLGSICAPLGTPLGWFADKIRSRLR